MFDLIVLGLVVAGLAAIARAPVPKDPTEIPTPPSQRSGPPRPTGAGSTSPPICVAASSSIAVRLDPLRRASAVSPSGQEAQPTVTGEAP